MTCSAYGVAGQCGDETIVPWQKSGKKIMRYFVCYHQPLSKRVAQLGKQFEHRQIKNSCDGDQDEEIGRETGNILPVSKGAGDQRYMRLLYIQYIVTFATF